MVHDINESVGDVDAAVSESVGNVAREPVAA